MGKRVCKVCGCKYEYPIRRSPATRFHCEECTLIDEPLRRLIGKMRQRIDRLAAEVEALKKRAKIQASRSS